MENININNNNGNGNNFTDFGMSSELPQVYDGLDMQFPPADYNNLDQFNTMFTAPDMMGGVGGMNVDGSAVNDPLSQPVDDPIILEIMRTRLKKKNINKMGGNGGVSALGGGDESEIDSMSIAKMRTFNKRRDVEIITHQASKFLCTAYEKSPDMINSVRVFLPPELQMKAERYVENLRVNINDPGSKENREELIDELVHSPESLGVISKIASPAGGFMFMVAKDFITPVFNLSPPTQSQR